MTNAVAFSHVTDVVVYLAPQLLPFPTGVIFTIFKIFFEVLVLQHKNIDRNKYAFFWVWVLRISSICFIFMLQLSIVIIMNCFVVPLGLAMTHVVHM